MNPFFIAICGFVILLGFEIRFRNMAYEINLLKIEIMKLGDEILKSKEEVNPKQNITEERVS
jgi:hypothetical protein